MKKIVCLILALSLFLSISACNVGLSGQIKGAHVFMFKSTGNTFGDLMYRGFEKVMTEAGEKSFYRSPAESTVAAQVEMLDTLITQGVASITISTNGEAGYDEVFKRAKAAGIKIISVDSSASPLYRMTHIDATDPQAIGSALIQAAVLISNGIDYPADGDLEKATSDFLATYSGKQLSFGVLTAGIDTPVQNKWIECMRTELKKDFYAGKVSENLEIKYGNDDPNESTTQANAFVAENTVDVIISPTTVGMAAAGQVLKNARSGIKLTGLGLPSEMQGFMPKTPDDNAFDFVCPYMFLWNVIELGEVAAASALAATENSYDGAVGSSFTYNGNTYITENSEDNATHIIALKPYVFNKNNMTEWTKLL